MLSLTCEDNGIGFDVSDSVNDYTYGLQNMNNRSRLMNGSFQIDSNIGKGTFVSVGVPLKDVSL